ncbi:WD repeat- and FYVE domain-containing protein 4 [Merluccius polli]|uniref:WD repeat- and FYVE domain-containing protein 4 n=1 Tax=Merluccius polli TaxID=89951 RepID=A0AA47NMH3_MERPO|nr:WD repeat- and FYVE domain-containing protein 4 [Merluccius polli]
MFLSVTHPQSNALEIFIRDGHTAFLVFLNRDHVSVYKRLCSVVPSLKGHGIAEVIANARLRPCRRVRKPRVVGSPLDLSRLLDTLRWVSPTSLPTDSGRASSLLLCRSSRLSDVRFPTYSGSFCSMLRLRSSSSTSAILRRHLGKVAMPRLLRSSLRRPSAVTLSAFLAIFKVTFLPAAVRLTTMLLEDTVLQASVDLPLPAQQYKRLQRLI